MRHFNSFQELANNNPQDQTHTISCKEIIESHKQVSQMNQFSFKLNPNDESSGSFSFSKGDQVFPENNFQLQYRCKKSSSLPEENIFYLEISFERSIDPLSQAFPQLSVYEMTPVANSFWEEIFDLTLKLYAPETGESLIIYQDDIPSSKGEKSEPQEKAVKKKEAPKREEEEPLVIVKDLQEGGDHEENLDLEERKLAGDNADPTKQSVVL